MYFTLPHLPPGISSAEVALYDHELHDPTGIRSSLKRPPNYWDGVGLGGVIVADECGWALGIEGGKGVRIDEFWSKSVSCECTSAFYPHFGYSTPLDEVKHC